MSLDLTKLESVVIRRGVLEARCPACAENGEDQTGNHLFIENEGDGPSWGCVVNAGPSGADHRRVIWELVGDKTAASKPAARRVPRIRSVAKGSASKPPPTLPNLRVPDEELLDLIMELRGWPSLIGLQMLVERGLLWHADVYDNGEEWPAWVVTDSARVNAQARTYDGAMWQGIGGKKAKSLLGTTANWPIGAPDIGDRPYVILCEGQPDFCAALLVAWFEMGARAEAVAPVCMTGAGNSINPSALHYFAGKLVRIMTHNDPEGQGERAAKMWAQQLICAGAHVDGVSFAELDLSLRDGSPIKDLADYATLLDYDFCPEEGLLSGWA